ncbi:MAG: DUF3570 domain-containing protein [Gammaproteobacteria bacterium]
MAATKKPQGVRNALRLATCTLLSSAAMNTQAEEEEKDWLFDGAVLHYSEEDRVQVLEPVFSFRKYKQFDEYIEYKLTIDAMTGSSPNGATPSSVPQTFTGSSGTSGYSVPADVTPMRDFDDTRLAFNVNSETPLSNVLRRSAGLALSLEQDYGSFGYNLVYSKDVNDKHTTLTGGAGISLDLVYPDGGAPDPLTNVNDPANQQGGEGEDDDDEHEGGDDFESEFKGMFDVMVGVTQVVNRYTLMQLNYSHGFIRGYLTDPYKLVSVVDSASGEPALTPTTTNGIYLTEKRPDQRDTNSIYWKSVVSIFGDVFRVSYRYFWDDWGIKSNTIDIKYRLGLWGGFYLQPHYRYYTQTAADFYRHSLRDNEPTPDYVSADYRLGEFTGKTVGLKLGVDFSNSTKFDIRFEKYTQTGESYPDDAVGIQKNYDLYPTLEATIFQISFSKYF